MTEEAEQKKVSKLSSLIGQAQENFDGLQIYVHYSENNWETSEEINLILDQNTKISQLIDSSVKKFKTELFYDNIDKKKFNVRIFKKKKKIPNLEYPICNPNSKIGEFGKTHFCLVEQEEEKEKEEGDTVEEEDVEEKKEEIKNEINDINKEKENKKEIKENNNISSETNDNNKNNTKTDTSSNNKTNKNNCRPCVIF